MEGWPSGRRQRSWKPPMGNHPRVRISPPPPSSLLIKSTKVFQSQVNQAFQRNLTLPKSTNVFLNLYNLLYSFCIEFTSTILVIYEANKYANQVCLHADLILCRYQSRWLICWNRHIPSVAVINIYSLVALIIESTYQIWHWIRWLGAWAIVGEPQATASGTQWAPSYMNKVITLHGLRHS